MSEKTVDLNKSLELNKISEEIVDILESVINPIEKSIDAEGNKIAKNYDNCGCDTCKSEDVSCEDCSECSANEEMMSKKYESDNEDEDKWDNMEKACWSGYTQRGMKDKNGRKVPNCVPVKKSLFGTDGPQSLIPRNK